MYCNMASSTKLDFKFRLVSSIIGRGAARFFSLGFFLGYAFSIPERFFTCLLFDSFMPSRYTGGSALNKKQTCKNKEQRIARIARLLCVLSALRAKFFTNTGCIGSKNFTTPRIFLNSRHRYLTCARGLIKCIFVTKETIYLKILKV